MPSRTSRESIGFAELFEQVRLNAELVVLAACRTGLGQDIRGEGVIVLTRAFLSAGARSVAVSLWNVSNTGTAELMKAFYRELRSGLSKDIALQRAMTSVAAAPRSRHPFYWAPFVLVGDWQWRQVTGAASGDHKTEKTRVTRAVIPRRRRHRLLTNEQHGRPRWMHGERARYLAHADAVAPLKGADMEQERA